MRSTENLLHPRDEEAHSETFGPLRAEGADDDGQEQAADDNPEL